MNIGKLDKRLAIIQIVHSPDGMGGRKSEEVQVATIWAEFLRPRFVTAEIQGTIVSEVTQGIRIRKNNIGIKKGWIVSWGDSKYDVLHVETIGQEIILTCKGVEK